MEASSTTVGESMKLSKEFYGRLAVVCIFIFFVIVINLNLLNAKKYGEAYSLDAYTSFIPRLYLVAVRSLYLVYTLFISSL